MGLLKGKKILIFGVANEKSIAYSIAKSFVNEGATIALSYLNNQLKSRVEPIANELGADFIFEMDVTVDKHYENLQKLVQDKWQTIDGFVHSLAFADRSDLRGAFSETSRDGFKLACDVSAFSLIGLSNTLKGFMNEGSSIISMTYHGSQKVLPGYNVMGVAKAALEASSRYLSYDLGERGIKVNCISAGPIRTLASSAVPGMREIFNVVENKSPLRKNISQGDVGKTASYLASDLSSGVTGQVLYVDSGISIIGI